MRVSFGGQCSDSRLHLLMEGRQFLVLLLKGLFPLRRCIKFVLQHVFFLIALVQCLETVWMSCQLLRTTRGVNHTCLTRVNCSSSESARSCTPLSDASSFSTRSSA